MGILGIAAGRFDVRPFRPAGHKGRRLSNASESRIDDNAFKIRFELVSEIQDSRLGFAHYATNRTATARILMSLFDEVEQLACQQGAAHQLWPPASQVAA